MKDALKRCLLVSSLGLLIAGTALAADPVCPPEGGERHTVVGFTKEGLLVLDDGSEARAIGVLMPHPPRQNRPAPGRPSQR